MKEAPSNKLPINQAALAWLKEAKDSPDGSLSYLAQLASWGFEKDVVNVPAPRPPSQPRYNLENAVNVLMRPGEEDVAFATDWFLSNPNLDRDEQEGNLLDQLNRAENPSEAAQAVVEAAYDLMVAGSATFEE